jgi:hypothetical protein
MMMIARNGLEHAASLRSSPVQHILTFIECQLAV